MYLAGKTRFLALDFGTDAGMFRLVLNGYSDVLGLRFERKFPHILLVMGVEACLSPEPINL